MEKVVEKNIIANELQKETHIFKDLEVKVISLAEKSPSLKVNIYAEGYHRVEKIKFWQQAIKAVESLQNEHFPGLST